MLRAGGAVEPQRRYPEGLENHRRRRDVGAQQHPADRIQRDLGLDGDLPAGIGHGSAAPYHGSLYLEDVLARLHQQKVHAPLDEPLGLLPEDLDELGVGESAQRRVGGGGKEPRGAQASRHEPRPIRGGELGCDLPGQAGRLAVHLPNPGLEAVLREAQAVGAESVGFHDVTAHLQEGGVNVPDEVRPGEDEVIVAPVQLRTSEIVRGRLQSLDARAHGPVEDQDPFPQGFEISAHEKTPHRLKRAGHGGSVAMSRRFRPFVRLPGSSKPRAPGGGNRPQILPPFGEYLSNSHSRGRFSQAFPGATSL